jgi:hypothetical protein
MCLPLLLRSMFAGHGFSRDKNQREALYLTRRFSRVHSHSRGMTSTHLDYSALNKITGSILTARITVGIAASTAAAKMAMAGVAIADTSVAFTS